MLAPLHHSLTTLELLFRTKLDCPQLHQVALASLIERSDMLARLLGEPAPVAAARWSTDELPDHDFEVTLAGGGRVWVAVSIDAPPRGEALQRQASALAEAPDARALHLLLGAAAITRERDALVGPRVVIRDAGAVLSALAELRAPAAGQLLAPVVERLRVEYHRQLEALDARTSGFASKPVATWGAHDFLGFFDRCRRYGVGSMAEASVEHLVRRAGDRVTCAWRSRVAGADGSIAARLQFDDARLVVKLSVEDAARRTELRNAAFELLSALPVGPPLAVQRPARFGHGATMTLAIIEGVTPVADPGSPGFQSRIRTAEALLDSFARQLAATPQPIAPA